MNKARIARTTTKSVASMSTSLVVQQIIKNNTNPKNLYHKVGIYIGSFCIGWMITDAIEATIDRQFDEIEEAIAEIKTAIHDTPESTE